ncbi:MAG: mechanosensitive ion channel family protein [Candidatus Dormiibacterota bacterium]
MLSTRIRPRPGRRRPGWLTAALAVAALAAVLAARRQLLALLPASDGLVVQMGIFVFAMVMGGVAIRSFTARTFSHLRGSSLYAWRPVVTWCLYLLLALGVLSALQIDLTGLLAAGAVVGVVVGVAAQTSLGSVFAGIVLLMARPFVVGNFVHIRTYLFGGIEYQGIVTHIGVVYTSVDLGGRLVRIPNSGVLLAALTVTHLPLQLDIEVQLPPETELGRLSQAISASLGLQPGESVGLHPLQLQTAGDGQLTCQLQIRCHRQVEVGEVSRVIRESRPAEAAPGAEGA